MLKRCSKDEFTSTQEHTPMTLPLTKSYPFIIEKGKQSIT